MAIAVPHHVIQRVNHLVSTPATELPLARLLQLTHRRRTQQLNREHGWSAHLWHARFFSRTRDEAHFSAAIRYVEHHPVRAGMVVSAAE